MRNMVQIHWDPEFEELGMSQDIQSYQFSTAAELTAFMEGVAAARDTMSHEVLHDSREAMPLSTDVQMVCRDCGSEEVLKDAWAEWDSVEQRWVLQNDFDDAYCVPEDGPTKIKEVNFIEWQKSQEEKEGETP